MASKYGMPSHRAQARRPLFMDELARLGVSPDSLIGQAITSAMHRAWLAGHDYAADAADHLGNKYPTE